MKIKISLVKHGCGVDNSFIMKPFISYSLLALAILQGTFPADRCILKMTGICPCSAHVDDNASDCCHEEDAAGIPGSSHAPDQRHDERKPCCAFMPANNLLTEAPAIPVVDNHQEVLPTPFVSVLESLLNSPIDSPLSFQDRDSFQPFDTPLYLRIHSFLI